jgi:hypothetical protein
MFVVMARSASEAEILGVKSHILAEGMTRSTTTAPSGSSSQSSATSVLASRS